MTQLQHQQAAAARQPFVISDDALASTFISLRGGAGVDNLLLDQLDDALTSQPSHHLYILVERSPLGSPEPTLGELIEHLQAAEQGKPKPAPKPKPKPEPPAPWTMPNPNGSPR